LNPSSSEYSQLLLVFVVTEDVVRLSVDLCPFPYTRLQYPRDSLQHHFLIHRLPLPTDIDDR